MRSILLCITTLLALSSCTRYVQMVTVKSDILEQDSMLRYSNDTFEIVYNLFEENGLLAFSIYNKSDKPLYIDWKRSALIQGEQRRVYWENTSTFYAVTTGSTIKWFRDYSESRNYTYGVISTPEKITFIPPKTAVSMARFRLDNNIWHEGLREEKVIINDTLTASLVSKEFENTSSPVAFRNFLTLSLDHKFESEFYIDHSFWASRISHLKEKDFIVQTGYLEENGFITYDYIYPFKKPNVYYTKFSVEY